MDEFIPRCMKKHDEDASDKRTWNSSEHLAMKRNGDKSKQILGKPKAKELKDIARTHQVTKTPST